MAEVIGFLGAAVTAGQLLVSLSSFIDRCKESKEQLEGQTEVFEGLKSICQQIQQTSELDTEDVRNCLESIDKILKKHSAAGKKKKFKIFRIPVPFRISAVKDTAQQLEQHKSNLTLAIVAFNKRNGTADKGLQVMHANMVDQAREARSLLGDTGNSTFYCGSYAGDNVNQRNGIDSEECRGQLVYCGNVKSGRGTQINYAPGGIFIGNQCIDGIPGESWQINGPIIHLTNKSCQ